MKKDYFYFLNVIKPKKFRHFSWITRNAPILKSLILQRPWLITVLTTNKRYIIQHLQQIKFILEEEKSKKLIIFDTA